MDKRFKPIISCVIVLSLFLLYSLTIFCGVLPIHTAYAINQATLNDNFDDNSVIVVLTEEATKKSKEYFPEDFPELECASVSNYFLQDKTAKVSHNRIQKNIHQILSIKLSNKDKQEVLNAIDKLSLRKDIISAEPNYYFSLGSVGIYDDEDATDNSVYENYIQLSSARQYAGTNTIKVAVIDSGIDATHEDLVGRVNVNESCSIDSQGNRTVGVAQDDYGHGTMVAGIIGAIMGNNKGIDGVCQTVELLSIACTTGINLKSVEALVSGIEWATSKGAQIINYSGQIMNITTTEITSLSVAINNFPGLFVTIAGNKGNNIDNIDNRIYPAVLTNNNLLVVSAIDRNKMVIQESCYGAVSVDLFAPGKCIFSTYPSSICEQECENNSNHVTGYHSDTGTSFAAPYVAGVAALILSQNPTLTPEYVKNAIMNHTDPLIVGNPTSYCVTGGYLNAYKAITSDEATHVHTVSSYQTTSTSHYIDCTVCGYVFSSSAHTYTYSNVTSTTHKQRCAVCGYNAVVPHLWRVISKTTTGHVKECNCGRTVDEAHTWVQNALGGYICSVCRQTGNFTPGIQSLLTPAGKLALQAANLQHGQVALIEGLPIIYFNGEYYLISESTTQVPYPIPPVLQTE